jgi:hypothetical protein
MKCLDPPWSKKVTCKKVTWGRTPLGLETVLPIGRALRWPWKEAERRWNLFGGTGAAPGG